MIFSFQFDGQSVSVKRSHGLFEPEFVTYKRAVVGCSAVLAIVIIIGAKARCAKKLGWISFRLAGLIKLKLLEKNVIHNHFCTNC